MTRLLILGSANADHVMNLEYLPSAGQTLLSQNYRLEHGGKGANQAVTVARLRDPNTRVDFICHLGDDAIGEAMANSWLSDGIQSDGINTQSDVATGTAMIFVANNGENMIGVSAGANASLTPKALEKHRQLIIDADYLLVQLENPVVTIIAALALAKEHGVTTILNPAPATVLGKELFGLVDIITPNETEAEALTGIEVTDEESAKFAAQMLHQLGPKTVIITLGQQGALLSCEGFSGIIPAVEVKPIDTVAAGDTFNGALMVALSEGKDMVSAVKFAHQAAALTVTREGAQRSIPYRHEIAN
ncbi:ribokinase [Shewanella psychrotolerans]|uniref:ribokinase n=1 Tax=Shewanella psychrotolerans TaxID=2864206 RepID=UPI001C66215B|nr:ribokinase [Shewanella psychrotolerans]QYK02043.1 ribokinase [Shewanella psychrotolerans]